MTDTHDERLLPLDASGYPSETVWAINTSGKPDLDVGWLTYAISVVAGGGTLEAGEVELFAAEAQKLWAENVDLGRRLRNAEFDLNVARRLPNPDEWAYGEECPECGQVVHFRNAIEATRGLREHLRSAPSGNMCHGWPCHCPTCTART